MGLHAGQCYGLRDGNFFKYKLLVNRTLLFTVTLTIKLADDMIAIATFFYYVMR